MRLGELAGVGAMVGRSRTSREQWVPGVEEGAPERGGGGGRSEARRRARGMYRGMHTCRGAVARRGLGRRSKGPGVTR